MKAGTSVALALCLTACGHSGHETDNPDYGFSDTDGSTARDGSPTNDNGDAGTNIATLTWDAPTTYTNGTPLTVAGYHVYFGTTSGAYATPIDAHMSTNDGVRERAIG